MSQLNPKHFMAFIAILNLFNFVFLTGSSTILTKVFVFCGFIYGMVLTAFAPIEIAAFFKRQ